MFASLLSVVACVAEERAGAALKEAEEVITNQHAEAIRYAPDAFKAVMQVYDTARKSLEAKDYRQALASAQQAAEEARELPRAIAAGRKAFTEQWNTMSAEVAAMLDVAAERVTVLDRARRLPADVTRADVAAAKEELPKLKATLADATRSFQRGRVAEAVQAGSQLRTELAALSQRLGLSAGA